MKIFNKYLGLKLKRSTVSSLVLLILALIFIMVQLPELTKPSILTEEIKIDNGYIVQEVVIYQNCQTGMHLLATVLGILATLIPIIQCGELKNRRNLDTLYSLPISRIGLAGVHFISGFIQVIFVYTVTFFSAYAFLLSTDNKFDLEYMLLYYPLSIIAGLLIYSFFSFLISKANTLIDGIATSGLWVLATFLLSYYFLPLYVFFPLTNHGEISSVSRLWSQIYAPLNNLTVIFMKHAEPERAFNNSFLYGFHSIINNGYMFAVWGGIALLCLVGYFIHSAKQKSNSVGEISSSIFCYKLLIPLIAIVSYSFLAESVVFSIIFVLIGYIVYRRSFKLKPIDLIIGALSIILAIVIEVI